MGWLSKLEGAYDSAVGATTDAFEFLGNKLKGQSETEKGTESEEAAAGTRSANATSNSEKEATETTDSDKNSDQGKLSQDPFKMEFFRYPIEIQSLGTTIKHWIEIEISEIKSETLTVESVQGAITTGLEAGGDVLKSATEKATNVIESGVSNGDVAGAVGGVFREGLSATADIAGKLGGTASESLKGMITTVKKDSPRNKLVAKLAIYMPDTVFFNQRNNYSERTFDQVFGRLGQAAQIGSVLGKDLSEGIDSGTTSGIVNSLLRSPGGRELAGKALNGVLGSTALEEGLLKGAGFAINPQVELFFSGVDRRTFQFDFRFNSRSSEETREIQGIIKTLRKNAAPTLPGQGSGRYFIPPSIFDINFCYSEPEKGWKINEKLPKINRCVLESIDVNYNGSGKYITYEDGQPIDIEVRLVFKETDIMTRSEIEAGY